jgi:PAS domain S-box-containing protein
MVKIKDSIIFKVVFIIITLQSLIWLWIATTINSYQNNLLKELNKQQKEFVVKFISEQKKKTREKILQNLNKLVNFSKTALSYSLFNYEENSAKKIIGDVLLENEAIKAVEIYDSVIKDVFITAYKKGNKKIFSRDPLPKEYTKFPAIKKELIYEAEPLGYVKVYYDIEPMLEHLNKIQQEQLKLVNKKFTAIYKQAQEKEKKLIYYFLIAAILTIVVVVWILAQYINKPLNEIRRGLASFFRFLSNPKEDIRKIKINSKDEFGEIAEFINNGIAVSSKLHRELAELLDVIDKNVMICEFDENGRPIDMTEAFVKTCGYSKEELLKRNNIVCNLNLKKVIDYIEKNGSWVGEVKCVSKDNKELWMRSNITKKCTFENGECRYINILYNITDKKELEILKNNLEDLVEEKTSKIKALLNMTKESIKYASLIQKAILPPEEIFKEAFSNYFIIWEPKDVLGGDIYFLDEVRDNEYLLMVLDCTGHGVHGALMTMLVKALQIQIINELTHSNKEINPGEILQNFNNSIKHILKQYTFDSSSNAGFDGAVIYYNKNTKTFKIASANVPVFYIKNNEIFEIRGNKRSVGDIYTPLNYSYKNYDITLEDDMKFYVTTDGFLDQLGGEKELPFGKKRFIEIIKKYHNLEFKIQKEILLEELRKYQKTNIQTDDILVIGFKP